MEQNQELDDALLVLDKHLEIEMTTSSGIQVAAKSDAPELENVIVCKDFVYLI